MNEPSAEVSLAPANECITDAHVLVDRQWHFLEVTPEAGRVLGREPSELIGKHIWNECPVVADDSLREACERAMSDCCSLREEEFVAGECRWCEHRICTEGDGLRIYFYDASVRKLREKLEAGQYAILAGIAAQQPLARSLQQITNLHEALNPNALCSVLLMDSSGQRLLHGAAPSLPEAYNEAINGVKIGDAVGSCGTSAWRRQRIIVTDIECDPLWVNFKDLAAAHGLRACWSTPVLGSTNQVLGTFAVYYRQRRAPSANDLETIDKMLAMAAIAIESDAQVKRSRERDYFFQMSTEINCILDSRNERIVQSNPKFSEVSGYSAAELSSRHYLEFVHPDDHNAAIAAVTQLNAVGRRVSEVTFRLSCRDGRHRWVQWDAVVGADGLAFAVGRDVTERREAQAALAYADTHDLLTHLPHRVVFENALAVELERAKTVWVMLIGMDRFHSINESMGHLIGDAVLKDVAQRLRDVLGDRGRLARFTGDQFAVAVTDATETAVLSLANRLREALMQPFDNEGYRLLLTSSIGISNSPDHGSTPRDLLRRAEAAMGRVKLQGRDGICRFSVRQMRDIEERLQLGNRLRGALDRDEMSLHYQPLEACASGDLMGFEALLRWHDPDRGEISPVRFIPIAEALGLMPEIGQWVVEEACHQARDWLDLGYTRFSVAVNVSVQELQRPGLVRRVENAIARYRLPPGVLVIEITESSLMDNVDRARRTLLELKALGTRLALDDFGTGYSSLAYLKHFPIDKLKIDQSFVRSLPDSGDDAAIARTIVAMAHQLRMVVAAEGVETAAQAAFLSDIGCDELQGHYVGLPLPATDAERLFITRSADESPQTG